MKDIKVMQKPEWVSWDEIHELLLAAHKKNIEKGMTMKIPHLPGYELERKLGESGRCFVALDNDKLIGITAVRFYTGKLWYDRGKLVAHCMLSAILPKYQGLGINEELNELRGRYIREMKADIIHADTAENNKIIRDSAKREGFVDVSYRVCEDHNSVFFVKWIGGCPFTQKLIDRKFRLSKALMKIQYKPGKIERSRLLSLLCSAIRRLFSVE